MMIRLILLCFSLLCLLVIHMYMYFCLRTFLKKKWAQYKGEVSFLKRWFFLGISQWVKDAYSKTGKRVVGYSEAGRLYFILNVIIHLLFGVEVAVFLLFLFGVIGQKVIDAVIFIYFVSWLVLFLVVAIAEYSMNRKYHRSRYR